MFKRRVQRTRRSWQGRSWLSCFLGVCARGACDDEQIEHTVNIKEGDARPFGITRSYWLHRRTALFSGLIQLLNETGKHLHQ